MIIVSQIKEMIINFDTICVLGINKNNPKEILSTTNNGNTQTLGVYATKERAKEVLQEIRKTYFEENCEFENGMYHMQRTFEMPED